MVVTQEQRERALSIGINLVEERDYEAQWKENYYAVIDYVYKNNRLPSHGAKDQTEKNLGSWCKSQRQAKKGNGKSRELTDAQIKLLEKIPGWFWEQDLNSQWEDTFNSLVNFAKENNKIPYSHSDDEHEKRLGNWCCTQRKSKRGKGRNLLTEDQIKKLEQIPGWYWSK
jgi:hypothetical protein